MTLSNGQALAGAHIPALDPLRETAKLPPNASTLRAIRRASITGTFVTAKSGDKAAPWFRLASGGAQPSPADPAHGHRPNHPICSCHHAPRGGSTNSVVRAMSIMYVKCVAGLGHTYNSLTCGYLLAGMGQASKPAGHSHGGSSPSRTHAYVHADSPCT
jgi:hypothetical protein